jgi:hypothetical protein
VDIAAWLRELGLERYEQGFRRGRLGARLRIFRAERRPVRERARQYLHWRRSRAPGRATGWHRFPVSRTRASSAGGGVAGVRVDCHTVAACRYGSAISRNTLATGCRKYPGSRQARPVVAPAAAAFQFASRYRPPLNRGRLAPARLPHRFQTRRLPRHGGHHVDPDSG